MPGDSRIRWYICYERKRKTFWNKQRMTSIEWKKESQPISDRYTIYMVIWGKLAWSVPIWKPILCVRQRFYFFFFVDIFLSYDDEKKKIIQWFSKSWWFLFCFVFFRLCTSSHHTNIIEKIKYVWMSLTEIECHILNQYNR